MKKTLVMLVIAVACTLSVQAQQRMVFYEEFTGESCPSCAIANPALESLLNMPDNLPKIVHVAFMEPIPVSGNFYLSQKAINDARLNYYNAYWYVNNAEFAPAGLMDGFFPDSSSSYAGNAANFSQTDIDNEVTVPAPFNMSATHYYNAAGDSVFVSIHVHAVTDFSGTSLRLRTAYVKTMDFATPPGDNGETHFDNVVRAMLPNATGKLIPSNWTAGQDTTFIIKGKISGTEADLTGVTIATTGIVVWIQNDDHTYFRVQQAARSTPPAATGVKTVAQSMDVTLYPNPAKELVSISFTLDTKAAVGIKMMDVTGRIVKNVPEQSMGAGEQKINIATSDMAPGIYMISMLVNDETVTRRFAVTK